MIIEKHNFFIVTGGPGSGKSALIGALETCGIATVEESGRRIIREQRARGGKATHESDRLAYRQLMFDDAIQTFDHMRDESGLVFFDRGLPDLIGYSLLIDAPVPKALTEAARRYLYNRTVFVAPPWEEIYGQDEERGQDFAEAVATCDAMRAAYKETGYNLIDLPKTTVEERAGFAIGRAQVGGTFTAQSGSTPGSMPKTSGPRT